MWLLTLKSRKDDGAYAVQDEFGDKVLFLFEQEDDASSYAMMLEDDEMYEKPMEVVEVDPDITPNLLNSESKAGVNIVKPGSVADRAKDFYQEPIGPNKDMIQDLIKFISGMQKK